MAVQRREVPSIGLVTFQKRRGSRSVRIHIHGDEVKVTLPHWVAYAHAERFVRSRAEWIAKHRKPAHLLVDGSYIGKQHIIAVRTGTVLRTRTAAGKLTVTLPQSMKIDDPAVQTRIKKAAERVLLTEATQLMAPRVHDLALEHDFSYQNVRFKKLKSRWGSCDTHGNLTFNIFLMQLPWPLIDYVIVHELTHTIHHNHSRAFWAKVAESLPDFKEHRKAMKAHQPHIVVF